MEGGAEVSGLHSAAVAILFVGSMAGAGLLVSWIVTGKKDLEPWVGLAALATGWSAAWVQRSEDAFDRSLDMAMEAERVEQERDRRLSRLREA